MTSRLIDINIDPTDQIAGETGFNISDCHTMDQLKKKIRHVPDFPKPRDSVLRHHDAAAGSGGVSRRDRQPRRRRFKGKGIDIVVGIESRGFIFGAAVADRIGAGFSPVRKPGKLPSMTVRATYALEYGTDSLEIHDDAVRKGQRVLIVDDLLATGGTARATLDLVMGLGGEVHGLAFLIELAALNGRERLPSQNVHTVLTY